MRKTVRLSDVNLERTCRSSRGSRKRLSPFVWQKKERKTRQRKLRPEKGSGHKSLKTGQKKLPDSIRSDLLFKFSIELHQVNPTLLPLRFKIVSIFDREPG